MVIMEQYQVVQNGLVVEMLLLNLLNIVIRMGLCQLQQDMDMFLRVGIMMKNWWKVESGQ